MAEISTCLGIGQLDSNRHSNRARGLVIVCWALLVMTGMYYLMVHSFICGPRGENPRRWPLDSKLPHSKTKPTLLLFMHPLCPCSTSSLEELERILADCHGRMKTIIVFPVENDVLSIEASSLYRAARNTRDAEVLVDTMGIEARYFGAATSGHAFLYSPSGRLCFEGGITASRGHSGDNVGRSAIQEWLKSGRSEIKSTPVFGCGLLNPTSTGKGGAS